MCETWTLVKIYLAVRLRRQNVQKYPVVVTHANKGSDISYPFPTARMEYDPDDFARKAVKILSELMAGNEPETRVYTHHLSGLGSSQSKTH
ncbi:MAG: hypothetical protein ACLFWL_06410 [Candidatus Brocadiia bacterium]